MNELGRQVIKKVLSITLILSLFFSMGGCAKESYLQSLDKEMSHGGTTRIVANKAKTMEMTEREFYDFAISVNDFLSETENPKKGLIVEFEDGTGIQFFFFTELEIDEMEIDGFADYGVVESIGENYSMVLPTFGLILFDEGKVWYDATE